MKLGILGRDDGVILEQNENNVKVKVIGDGLLTADEARFAALALVSLANHIEGKNNGY